MFGTDTYVAWNLLVAGKGSLQKHHYHLQTPTENHGMQYICYKFLSDKYRYKEQELLFLLGIANLQNRIAIPWSTHEASRTSEDVQGIPQINFSAGP